jgi:hypothetical protein
MVMAMVKSTMRIKCTSAVGHFDGHGGLRVQCKEHCPMQHVKGYTGSHWTLPSGDYSLRIAPATARATGKQTTMNKYTYFAGRFDSHGNAPVCYCAHCPMWRSRASLEATGCRHWASIMSNNIKGSWLCRFFMFFHPQLGIKGCGLTLRPLFSMVV